VGLSFVEFVVFLAGAPRREAAAGQPVRIWAVVLALICVPAALLPAVPLLGS